MNPLVINLFAGPGAGKSTTAAGLFHALKSKGQKCELALEFAKDCVWEKQYDILHQDQLFIFAQQHRRLKRLMGHGLSYVITDSPLLFSIVYGKNEVSPFQTYVHAKFNEFNNLNIYLERTKPYANYGRSQTEKQAKKLDESIKEMLTLWAIPHYKVKANKNVVKNILEKL